MSREKELAKNTLIISFGTFLPKLMSLITVPIITGHLTKVEYGTYDLVTTLVSLLLPIATLQIQSAAFRFLIDYRSDENEKKKIISNIYFFIIPISIVVLVTLYFFLPKIEPLTRVLIIIYYFIDCLMLASQQIVRGLSYNKLYSICSIILSGAYMLSIIVTLQINDQGLNGVLLSFILANLVSLAFVLVRGGIIKSISINALSFPLIMKMLAYSWPMIPNTLSSWVLSTSDRLVLTAVMGIEVVAVYGVANKIPNLINTVKGTFIFAWQENASLAINDGDVERYYSNMFDRIFSIITGVTALLIGLTPLLFRLLIRGDYSDSYPQMPILYLGIFFSVLAAFLGGIYVAHKRTKNVGITTLLAAVCNLIIDLTTVFYIGIYAASISTLVSYTLLSVYRMYDVKKFQPISYKYTKIVFCIALLVCMCIICWINKFTLNLLNVLVGCIFATYINRKVLKTVVVSLKSKMVRKK